ncbi:GNAT family N-acetyltransferase [bacterium BFN5]|nr:GNAT family N-acetyltransferase [bacterium BFN5]QJW45138.1 GNAT family N-acetyltransferase [bacterium BFN5]
MNSDPLQSGFPELVTKRLLLRQIKEDDALLLHQYWTDPAVIEYLTLEPFKDIQETFNMIALLNSLLEFNQGIRWAITRQADHVVIGTCGFHNLKAEHKRAELGYELGKPFWKQGFMAEALAAIIPYGFEILNLNRIEAFVNFGNSNSTSILQRMGFSLDGLLREYEFAREQFVDQYCYSLLKQEYDRPLQQF